MLASCESEIRTTMKRQSGAKIIIIVLVILFNPFIFSYLTAQTVLWAQKGTSPGFEDGNAIATDDSGNVYVTGQFEFSTNFGPVTLTAAGGHDIFVAKYNTQGSLVWVRKAGGIDGDIGLGIGVDSLHNVYITGEIEKTVTFGPNLTLTSNGGNDIFVAKYDVNGNIVWAKGYGSVIGSDKGRALAVSPSGNCYLTGNFTDVTVFDNISLSSNGGNDIFITKVNKDGNVEWAKKAGGSKQDRGYGITIDKDENVFVTGFFAQSATFRNTTITSIGTSDTFVAKYDSTGSFKWVSSAGACCDTTKANTIAVDDDGNIYVAGSYNVATSFDGQNLTSAGLSDVFLAKFDSVGAVVWVKSAGGSKEDEANGVAVDNQNKTVYITGMISGTANFDNQMVPIAGYRDIYIAAYDLNGNLRWVRTYGGSHRDIGYSIAVDNSGYIYSTGIFNGMASFGSITLTGYPNENWSDLYVNKIAPPVPVPPTMNVSSINITPANCYDLEINFTPGNGDGRTIIARQGGPVNAMPQNGIQYSSNNIFGNGSDLGNGNFIVYDGPGNQVTVSGLLPGTQYFFTALEFNGYGASRMYSTSAGPVLSSQTSTYSISLSGLQSSICLNDTLTLIAGGTVTYDWSPSYGLSSTTSALVFASPHVTTTYTITGTTANGCHAERSFTITVNQNPVITVNPINPLCDNSSPITLNFATPTGGTYSGSGIMAGQFHPSVSGTGTFDVQYEYTSPSGCTSSEFVPITVNAAPVVTLASIPSVCSNSPSFVLSNGSPSGGIYNGIGVNAGIFNPQTGAGNYLISYNYTASNGCSSTATQPVTVNAIPAISLGNDTLLCANDIIILNPGSGYSSYLWSNGAISTSIIADSSGTGLGTKSVYVDVMNVYGCSNRDSVNILFDLCSGIKLHSQQFANNIYPNPFTKTTTVNVKEKSSVIVYDSHGRVVIREENISGDLTFGEELSTGIYYLQVADMDGRRVYKVIKGL